MNGEKSSIRKKVFIIAPGQSTFIRRDIEILQKHFDVRFFHYKGKKSLLLSLPKILKGVFQTHSNYSIFADNHAFWTVLFSKLLRKKSIVMIGGYEVAKITGLNYGLQRSIFFPFVVKKIFKLADLVISVSEGLKQDAIENLKVKPDNIIIVPNGFDTTLFHPKGSKDDLVLCSAICTKIETLELKGIYTLMETATLLPDTPFFIIGIQKHIQENIHDIKPDNVTFYDTIPQEQLISFYQRAKIYCQLSLREGHPNALSEAMLCECVPIGTDVAGIKDVIEDTGFLVPINNPFLTSSAIQKALQSDSGKKARERIVSEYSIQKREQTLAELFMKFVGNHK